MTHVHPGRRRCRRVGVVVAILLVAAACGGDDAESRACGPVERLVESSTGHVLPGTEPFYAHHPPTSGAHLAPGPDAGVYAEPIPEPEQVGALETGRVILQYAPDASTRVREVLEDAADEHDDVIVAPAATPIDGDHVVAFTAWEHRRLCDAARPGDVRAFVREFAGRGVDVEVHAGDG